jgi:hypothetical protein
VKISGLPEKCCISCFFPLIKNRHPGMF